MFRSSRIAPSVLLALLAATPCLAQAAQRHQLYVFAGQSNIAALANPNPHAAAVPVPPNVHAWLPTSSRNVPFGPSPLLDIATRIAVAHPKDAIHVAMIAQDGSALLPRNDFGAGYWINPAWLLDPGSLLMQRGAPLRRVFATAGLQFAEVHLIWGQGETDCSWIVGYPPTADEYALYSQAVIGLLAWQIADTTSYRAHLVTLGAIEHPAQSAMAANMLRDAYYQMENQTLTLPGWWPNVHVAAHHYDLPHPIGLVGVHHLTPAGYAALGQRIADGIQNPAGLPRVVPHLQIVNATDVQIATTVPLTTVPMGKALRRYFEFRADGNPVSDFDVGVQGSVITLRGHADLKPTSSVSVRYVAGSGYDARWSQRPLATGSGTPLEPFVLTR